MRSLNLDFVEYPDENFRLPVRAALINNFSFLAHWPNEIEMMLVLDGQLTIGINSETRNLQSEMDRKDKHCQLFVISLLHELIGLVLRHLPLSSNPGVYSESAAARKLTPKAIHITESNYSLPISLEGVANHLGITDVSSTPMIRLLK